MFSAHSTGGVHIEQPHMSMLRLRGMMRMAGLGQQHRMGLHAIGMGMHPAQAMHMQGGAALPHLPDVNAIAQSQKGLGVAPLDHLPSLPAATKLASITARSPLGSLRPMGGLGGLGGGVLGGL